VLLIYNIWFQNDMLDFIGLPAWRELRKQVVVAVEPERVAETEARYDRLMCSLAEGMAQGDVRSDFAQALEESREAAKQEARDLATGYVLGKIQKLQRAGKVFSFADSIWDNIPSAARAKGEEWFRQFGEKVIASRVRQIGPFTEFSVDVAGRVPGSFTRWVKVVDEYGRTIRVYHDTFDKTGRFIHRSIKFPGPERHVQ